MPLQGIEQLAYPLHILGGGGVDELIGGPGDDRFLILDACEIAPGGKIDGGAGTDTLVTPVPIEDLAVLGFDISGIEEVVVEAGPIPSDWVCLIGKTRMATAKSSTTTTPIPTCRRKPKPMAGRVTS